MSFLFYQSLSFCRTFSCFDHYHHTPLSLSLSLFLFTRLLPISLLLLRKQWTGEFWDLAQQSILGQALVFDCIIDSYWYSGLQSTTHPVKPRETNGKTNQTFVKWMMPLYNMQGRDVSYKKERRVPNNTLWFQETDVAVHTWIAKPISI